MAAGAECRRRWGRMGGKNRVRWDEIEAEDTMHAGWKGLHERRPKACVRISRRILSREPIQKSFWQISPRKRQALFGSAAEDGDCSTCCAENSNSWTRSSLKSPRAQHAQRDGRHGQPCLQTLLVLRPITLSATAAVSNRRPLTHEGASERRDDLFPISAGRAPAADLPPIQPRIMIQRTEGGSPGDKAVEGGDSHGCFIGVASYYSLMAGGGRHRSEQGEVSTLPTVFMWSRFFNQRSQRPPVTHGPSPHALLLAFFKRPTKMKAVLLLLASMVGFTAAFGTSTISHWCCGTDGGIGAGGGATAARLPWLSNSAHGRRTGPVHHHNGDE